MCRCLCVSTYIHVYTLRTGWAEALVLICVEWMLWDWLARKTFFTITRLQLADCSQKKRFLKLYQIVADTVEKQRALGSLSNCHRNEWNVLEQNRILSLETCKKTMLVGSFFWTLIAASRREVCTASIVAKKTRNQDCRKHLGNVPEWCTQYIGTNF